MSKFTLYSHQFVDDEDVKELLKVLKNGDVLRAKMILAAKNKRLSDFYVNNINGGI